MRVCSGRAKGCQHAQAPFIGDAADERMGGCMRACSGHAKGCQHAQDPSIGDAAEAFEWKDA